MAVALAGGRVRVYYDKRDTFGHFVTPPAREGKPCMHKCCRGYRPHPDHLPVRLDRAYLRTLTEAELEHELGRYTNFIDTHEAGFLQVVAEMTRRDESGKRAVARKERARRRYQERETEYKDEVYRQWLSAEAATNGYMVNKAGQRAGIDERTLFTGPESRVRKYASPELIEYFESHPRPTRASWFGSAQSRRAHLAGRRIGLWPAPTNHAAGMTT
jgi:hypothetical protein